MSDFVAIKSIFESLRPVLDERLCRIWAAAEAKAIGYGGVSQVSAATGLSRKTITIGLHELQLLDASPADSEPIYRPATRPMSRQGRDRVRLPGAGRKPTEVKDPTIIPALEQLLADEVAGDPMGEQRWIRSSLRHLSERLAAEGHPASPSTVARLLKGMGFSLRTNKRKQGVKGQCPERDEQFRYIATQRQNFTAACLPIISVDTKKRELIGNFRNNGRAWCKQAEVVDEHDFPSGAECRAVPFGVYDLMRNKGHVYVGVSNDTPEFAVVSIAKWWEWAGRSAYPRADRLLILADGGGSNGCRARAWKCNLQKLVSDRFGLTLTVCHYPTGCSKWNPVEHRMFSYISINWAGKPLRSLEIMLGYIRGTRTETGLEIEAFLDEGFYKKSVPYSHKDVDGLCLEAHDLCPRWNYTISPQTRTP